MTTPFEKDESADEAKLPHVPTDGIPDGASGAGEDAPAAGADTQAAGTDAEQVGDPTTTETEQVGDPTTTETEHVDDLTTPEDATSLTEPPAPKSAGPFGISLTGIRAGLNRDLLKSLWQRRSVSRIAFLAIAVYAACTLSMFFFIVKPVRARLHDVREEKSILHDYVVIQEAGAVVGHFKDGLMTGDQRLTVMSEVRLMADGSGVSIIGDPELLMPRQFSKTITEYPVRLRLRGTYHEIGDFMALLESSPRFVQVEEVEISSDAASRSRDSDATLLLALASWEG